MRLLVIASLLGCSSPAVTRDEAPSTPLTTGAQVVPVVARDAAAGGADALPELAIVDAPITWSAERERLTLEYRRTHSDPRAADLVIEPRVIVIHHTGGDSAAATRAYFDNVRIEAARKELARGGAVNVSAHFVVDRDGTIYRLQPETRFARHCIGLNHIAIGIENVGGGPKLPLTDAQVAADAALVRSLAARFPVTHLLGHHEVMGFRANPYYVERMRGYANDKDDPGDAFMASLRARLVDLELAER